MNSESEAIEKRRADFKIAEKQLKKLKKKSFNELMDMPSRCLLLLPELSEYSTLEFSRGFHEDGSLHINLRLWDWLSPDPSGKPRRTKLKLKLSKKEEAEFAAFMAEIEAMSEEERREAGVLMAEDVLEPLPHPTQPDWEWLSGCSSLDFWVEPDNTLIEDDEAENRKVEESNPEIAKWMGKTGLPTDIETELPRYIRRELGEWYMDEESTKASDMIYLGKALRSNLTVNKSEYYHVWQLEKEDKTFAYVEETYDENGEKIIHLGMFDSDEVPEGYGDIEKIKG